MTMILEYAQKNITRCAIELIERNEDVEIVVDNDNQIKWFLWYLPYLMDKRQDKSPFFKTLVSFFILRKFHAIFGTAHTVGGYEFDYILDSNKLLQLRFIRSIN